MINTKRGLSDGIKNRGQTMMVWFEKSLVIGVCLTGISFIIFGFLNSESGFYYVGIFNCLIAFLHLKFMIDRKEKLRQEFEGMEIIRQNI